MPFPIIPGGSPSSSYQVSRSLRFRSSASAYLSRTPASAGNRTTWTWSGWVKRGIIGGANNQGLFSCYTSGTDYVTIQIRSLDDFDFQVASGGTNPRKISTAVLRDPSAWYHLVAVADTNNATAGDRMRLYINGVRITSFSTSTDPSSGLNFAVNSTTTHTVGQFNSSNYSDCYLAEVNFIDGQALTPSSFGQSNALTGVWEPKAYVPTGTGYGTNGFYLPFSDNTNANTLCYDRAGSNTVVSTAAYFTPTGGVSQSSLNLVGPLSQLYDGVTTGQTTMYNNPVNSILQVDAGSGNTLDLTRWGFFLRNAFASETWSIQYSDDNSTWTNAKTGFQVSAAGWNDTTFTSVGAHRYWRAIVTTQVNGEYVTEYRLYGTGTYRTANDWTPNNISVATGTTYDSMIDSPTNYADGGNGRGNYCTFNPLAVTSVAATFADGNLTLTTGLAGGNCYGTFAIPSSGKWYWEITAGSGNGLMIGISAYLSTQAYSWQNSNSVFYYFNGQKYVDGTGSAYGASYTTNNIIGVAVDADAGTITFYKDNATQGAITHAVSGLFPCLSDGNSSLLDTYYANFGQRPFTYTPPSGYSALNTQNLPAPALTPSP